MKMNFRNLSNAVLALLAGFMHTPSSGQLLTNNGSAITILAGAQVTVKGDVQNNAGSTIDNSGGMDLSGNWTHNAANNCFGTSAGIVTLNGTDQVVGGTGNTMFNILQLQGTGTILLQTGIGAGGAYAVPTGVLNLGSQNLDLNGNELTITHQSNLALLRTSGFIQSETDPGIGYGSIKWNVANSPAGMNFEFPFGNISTNSYLPFSFNITTPGSATGYVRVSTYPTDPTLNPNNRPLPTGLPSLVNTAGTENAPNVIDRWWNVTTEDFTTTPAANLVFSYRESEWFGGTNTLNENLLQGQRFDGSVWSYPPTGTVNPAINEVTVFNVSNFNSIWTLVGSNSPLPVELLYFSAVPVDNKKVKCSWITESEINNDYFTIERSRDGTLFEYAGTVDGAGNSTQENYYSFDDENPYRGVSYYRLRQTDFDGRFSYSNTVAVELTGGKTGSAFVFPNPATDFIFIQITQGFETGEAAFEVHDATGRLVRSLGLSGMQEADNLFRMQRETLAPGIYFYRVINNGGVTLKGKIEFQ